MKFRTPMDTLSMSVVTFRITSVKVLIQLVEFLVFSLPAFEPPNPEEMAARRLARTAGKLASLRAGRPDQSVFSAVSLLEWLPVARAAGLRVVDAQKVASLPMEVIMRFDRPQPEDSEHWERFRAAQQGLLKGEMLRWDCCAPISLKMAMSDGGLVGELPVEVSQEISVDDPRLFDILMAFPLPELAVVKRPWIQARIEGSHPVEYRAFILNGEVLGVANYYVQRGLSLTDQVDAEVRAVLQAARQLCEHMRETRSLPFSVGMDGEEADTGLEHASCTLDFLAMPDSSVVFLEAGPPFGLGAHPCSFIGNRDQHGQIDVRGVCLSNGAAPLPLKDFESSGAPRQRHR